MKYIAIVLFLSSVVTMIMSNYPLGIYAILAAIYFQQCERCGAGLEKVESKDIVYGYKNFGDPSWKRAYDARRGGPKSGDRMEKSL